MLGLLVGVSGWTLPQMGLKADSRRAVAPKLDLVQPAAIFAALAIAAAPGSAEALGLVGTGPGTAPTLKCTGKDKFDCYRADFGLTWSGYKENTKRAFPLASPGTVAPAGVLPWKSGKSAEFKAEPRKLPPPVKYEGLKRA